MHFDLGFRFIWVMSIFNFVESIGRLIHTIYLIAKCAEKFNERKSIINHTDEWLSMAEEEKNKRSCKYDKESKKKIITTK